MDTYVTYLRVSTQRQGTSGLGLEAQRAAVKGFVKEVGQIVGEFIEVESGKKDSRPQLAAAIDEAKRTKSVLLIAKLDRLSRNAGFIFALRDSGVNFRCSDMPDANILTVGIFATLAEYEQETISRRTRDALAAKKARGEQLGNVKNLTEAGRRKARETMQDNARAAKENVQASQLIQLMMGQKKTTRQIAEALNTSGYRTRRQCAFTSSTVSRLAKLNGAV